MDEPKSKPFEEDLADDDVLVHTPALKDEESVSGSSSNPESDDDTLENAHEVGLQLNDTDDGEGKKEKLNIARDIDNAEKALWES
jgi:hypothetical protein